MVPDAKQITLPGWVNGNDYERASETFGVLPLSGDTRTKLGMLEYHPDFAKDFEIRHPHLTQLQRTRMAILPVHTPEEKALYRLFVNDNTGHFAGDKQPNWIIFAQQWSARCNGKTIFYKVGCLIPWFMLHFLTAANSAA
jgi:hypothetical protein